MKQLEKKYVGKLMDALKKEMPGFPIFKHADRVTNGIPDISIHGNCCSLWIEVKRIGEDSKIISKGIQDRTMEKLAKHSFGAIHVIFDEQDGHTYIVHPVYLHDYRTAYISKLDEFAYRAVALYVKKVMDSDDSVMQDEKAVTLSNLT